MMGPRWLALPLAGLTAFATATGCATAPAPRMLSADLHIGSLDDRTSFELDDSSDPRGSAPEGEDDDLDDLDDPIDTPKQQRIRKLLYRTGLGALGFGIVGTVGFGIGGRIVQAQMKHGYEDGDLTHAREDQLSTTGTVMNALAITSAVIGLAGVITAATVYGVDHARCGELRPRRKQCAHRNEGSGVTTGAPAGGTGPAPSDASEGAGADGSREAGGPSEVPADASSTGNPSGGTGPAASSGGPSPVGPSPAPTESPGPAAPGPSPSGKRASSPGASAGQ